MKSSEIWGVETRNSFVELWKIAGFGSSKLNDRIWMPRDFKLSHRDEFKFEKVQIRRSVGGMRLCFRIAFKVAPPSHSYCAC